MSTRVWRVGTRNLPNSLIAEQLVEIMHDVGSKTTGVERKLMGVYDGSVEVEMGGRGPTVEDKRKAVHRRRFLEKHRITHLCETAWT